MQKDIESLIELQEMKEVDSEAATRFQAYLVKKILDENPFEIVEIKDNYIGIVLGEASENTEKNKKEKKEFHVINTPPQSIDSYIEEIANEPDPNTAWVDPKTLRPDQIQ